MQDLDSTKVIIYVSFFLKLNTNVKFISLSLAVPLLINLVPSRTIDRDSIQQASHLARIMVEVVTDCFGVDRLRTKESRNWL